MPDEEDAPVKFPSALQTAIFSFAMSLITQYKQTMAPIDAVRKTADWLRSLADKMEREAQAYADDVDAKVKESNKGEQTNA